MEFHQPLQGREILLRWSLGPGCKEQAVRCSSIIEDISRGGVGMTFHKQTLIPHLHGEGNCYETCMACLFDMKIDDVVKVPHSREWIKTVVCLLYTSDAADERSSVDLGGRR